MKSKPVKPLGAKAKKPRTTPTEEQTVGRPKMGVNSFSKEMAEIAARATKAESKSAGATTISTKGGHFSINKNKVKGDKITVVVVESIFCNTFYADTYDPANVEPPECYAYAQDSDELAPHKEASEPQCDNCADCPMNKWGTALKGRGKACKNQRRLAVICEDAEEAFNDEAAQLYMLSVSVTSVKAWSGYVQDIYNTRGLPVCGVVTEIEIYTPEDQTYAELSFSYVRDLEQDELAAIMPRRDGALKQLNTPFPKMEDEAPKKKKKVAGKPTTGTKKFSARRDDAVTQTAARKKKKRPIR